MTDDIGELVLKDREMLSSNGLVCISATLSKKDKEIVIEPDVVTRGFIYAKDNMDMIEEIKKISSDVIKTNIYGTKYADYVKIRNDIRTRVGDYLYKETACRPVILTVIQEL